MNKDLNRLKVILAEKKEPTNGWLINFRKTQQRFRNGALIHSNQIWKL